MMQTERIPPALLVLMIARPGAPLESFETSTGRITIGSGPGQDVVLDDLAPQHAVITLGKSNMILFAAHPVDLGGVKVEGRPVAISPGTVMAMGRSKLRIRIGGPQVRTSPPKLGVEAGGAGDGVSPPARPAPGGDHDAVVAAGSPGTTRSAQPVSAELRRTLHRRLIDRLDLVRLDRTRMNDYLLRAKVVAALGALVDDVRAELPHDIHKDHLVDELTHEAIGLGPLDALLADAQVSEIMVLDASTVYVERQGKMIRTDVAFTDEDATRTVLERIVAPLGRRIDEASPLLDARLPDGSRVNAVIPPLALRGTCLTIRKFPARPLTMADLLERGSVSDAMARLLVRAVRGRKNIVVSGGTGSGKTTMLNLLSGFIPAHERIVTIEDAAELRLQQPHVVTLEARPPNLEGQGEITIRDLVRNAMRMRPDRILVGECRGSEALDMLQAMNTGHDGSMTTTHANSPHEAVKRIEMLCLMSGIDVPSRALREHMGLSLHLVVQQARLGDGSRRIVSVAEVTGLDRDGEVSLQEVFGYRSGRGTAGEFYMTGYVPTFLGELRRTGVISPEEPLL